MWVSTLLQKIKHQKMLETMVVTPAEPVPKSALAELRNISPDAKFLSLSAQESMLRNPDLLIPFREEILLIRTYWNYGAWRQITGLELEDNFRHLRKFTIAGATPQTGIELAENVLPAAMTYPWRYIFLTALKGHLILFDPEDPQPLLDTIERMWGPDCWKIMSRTPAKKPVKTPPKKAAKKSTPRQQSLKRTGSTSSERSLEADTVVVICNDRLADIVSRRPTRSRTLSLKAVEQQSTVQNIAEPENGRRKRSSEPGEFAQQPAKRTRVDNIAEAISSESQDQSSVVATESTIDTNKEEPAKTEYGSPKMSNIPPAKRSKSEANSPLMQSIPRAETPKRKSKPVKNLEDVGKEVKRQQRKLENQRDTNRFPMTIKATFNKRSIDKADYGSFADAVLPAARPDAEKNLRVEKLGWDEPMYRCQKARLFLAYALFLEKSRHQLKLGQKALKFNVTAAQQTTNADVNKIAKMHEAFEDWGWIKVVCSEDTIDSFSTEHRRQLMEELADFEDNYAGYSNNPKLKLGIRY